MKKKVNYVSENVKVWNPEEEEEEEKEEEEISLPIKLFTNWSYYLLAWVSEIISGRC